MREAYNVIDEAIAMFVPGNKQSLSDALQKVCLLQPSKFPERNQLEFIRLLDKLGVDWRNTGVPDDEKRESVRQAMADLRKEDLLKITYVLIKLQVELGKALTKV